MGSNRIGMNPLGTLGPLLLSATAAVADIEQPVSYPSPLVFHDKKDDGRRLRGDWEPADAYMLVYTDSWDDAFDVMVDALARRGLVFVLREEGQPNLAVRQRLRKLDPTIRDTVWDTGIEVDSTWVRDYGPFLVRHPKRGMQWIDAPYTDTRQRDEDALPALADLVGIKTQDFPYEFDGGAIVSNGDGLCVSTIEFFESADIDPEDTATMRRFMRGTGCPHLVLVPALMYEETKHVDLFLQFTEPGVAVLADYDPALAPFDAVRMDAVETGLREAAERFDIPLEIVRVPSPDPDGVTYASYVNFFRASDAALVPSYASVSDRREAAALKALERAMPGIELVMVPSEEILLLGGGIHCITKELDLTL